MDSATGAVHGADYLSTVETSWLAAGALWAAASLRDAERLVVQGDVTFGAGVVVRGAVEIEADEPRRIEDGAVLSG